MSGAVIIGAGPGLGLSIARRFARERLPIALVARSASGLRTAAHAVASVGAPCATAVADSSDETALRAALDTVIARFGVPEVVVYNAAIIRSDRPGELSVRAHQDAWAVNVVGAITAAAHVAPAMAQRGSGSFIITGGMPQPDPEHVSLSLGKAGVRALVTLLDTLYRPQGLHVGTVTVAGAIGPGTDFDPDDIADAYWRLHTQAPRDRWAREIVYAGHDGDRSR